MLTAPSRGTLHIRQLYLYYRYPTVKFEIDDGILYLGDKVLVGGCRLFCALIRVTHTRPWQIHVDVTTKGHRVQSERVRLQVLVPTSGAGAAHRGSPNAQQGVNGGNDAGLRPMQPESSQVVGGHEEKVPPRSAGAQFSKEFGPIRHEGYYVVQ